MKEIYVVLRLITSSPNLEELQISVSYGEHYDFRSSIVQVVISLHYFNFWGKQGSSNALVATEAPDLDLWEKESLSKCKFKKLRLVKMTDMSSVPHEMEFIKFLLSRSPVLERMSINPCVYVMDGRLNMLIELVRFRRASAKAEILFLLDQVFVTYVTCKFFLHFISNKCLTIVSKRICFVQFSVKRSQTYQIIFYKIKLLSKNMMYITIMDYGV